MITGDTVYMCLSIGIVPRPLGVFILVFLCVKGKKLEVAYVLINK